MQTFLPYPDFVASAEVLDDRRLGKQRVETFQVLRALTWPTYGWKNHPATRMWRGFVPALVAYGLATCDAWERRGHAEATRGSLLEFTGGRVPHWHDLRTRGQLPPWLGLEAFHISHQSALVRKDPEFYGEIFPDVPDDLLYLWPAATFPRWPLRRGRINPLSLPEALETMGLECARPLQESAVEAVQAGLDHDIVTAPGEGATTAALLSGLCTHGTTLWLTGGTPLPHRLSEPTSVAQPLRATAKASPSIARQPSEHDARSMLMEAGAEPEYAFHRLHSRTGTLDETDLAQLAEIAELDHVGLVVLDHVGDADQARSVADALRRRAGSALAQAPALVLGDATDVGS